MPRQTGVLPFFSEHNDVLPGQCRHCLHPFERLRGHFFADLGFGHLVDFLNRHLRVFRAKLDEDNPSARLERLANGLRHFERMIELVINVHHQNQID